MFEGFDNDFGFPKMGSIMDDDFGFPKMGGGFPKMGSLMNRPMFGGFEDEMMNFDNFHDDIFSKKGIGNGGNNG